MAVKEETVSKSKQKKVNPYAKKPQKKKASFTTPAQAALRNEKDTVR